MPVVAWPPSLVERIAANQWVLFVGSGVSASCTNHAGGSPPTWEGLLTTLCALIADHAHRTTGEQLIAGRDFLAAADHIRYSLANEARLSSYQQSIRLAVEGPAGDKFVPSTLFDALLNLEPKIVFTTNYDKLFEIASTSGFRTHQVNSPDLSDDLRLGEPVLVKLHGSTDAINHIILTRTDYASVTKTGRDVFDALRALSLTSTFLFVGYSLEDPDIQLVLQAVGRPGMSPEAHFMLAPEPESPSRMPVFKESFGVSVLAYPAGHHSQVEVAIRELGDLVLGARTGSAPR
ncbi:MAG TPA: SIR2 family protein [Solirubrobacteraceae bacterium]|jgi:hypothetical protein|nr:SIR2 family protein [Solirubrobacteraceae bacterium]